MVHANAQKKSRKEHDHEQIHHDLPKNEPCWQRLGVWYGLNCFWKFAIISMAEGEALLGQRLGGGGHQLWQHSSLDQIHMMNYYNVNNVFIDA